MKLKKRRKINVPGLETATFLYLKLMLSKSSSATSAKLILCSLLGLYLSVVMFWLGIILLVSSLFISEINDN